MAMVSISNVPYVIVNAFTDRSFGGNPAAVVSLPSESLTAQSATLIDTTTIVSISQSLAQPIVVFLSPPGSDDSSDSPIYDIRFFANAISIQTCGHGMFATTKAICRGMLPGISHDVSRHPIVKLRRACGTIISARALGPLLSEENTSDSEFYELMLPIGTMEEVTMEIERDVILTLVAQALRTEVNTLRVKYVAHGLGDMSHRVVIVLDENEELEGREIDAHLFKPILGRFRSYTLTHGTPGKETAFVSRSFSSSYGAREDHVCGSAHSLMVPYYAAQPNACIAPGRESFVRQVGPRVGSLWVTLDEAEGVTHLRGNGKLFAKGEIIL
ncbi:hypothetical protein V8B97DRAFT_1126187 [Scleroderma yunnanense]